VTHLPYILGSYGLALAVGAAFVVEAWLRLRRAQRRLDAIDPRRRRERG
jgi:HAMP domain-containing protein